MCTKILNYFSRLKLNRNISTISNPTNSIYVNQIRNISTNQIGIETNNNLILKTDYPINKCKQILKNDTISVLGYGPQGKAQSLNLRDNQYNVILGLRKNGQSWNNAMEDGWIPEKNLFEIDEATYNGTIVKYLLSDAGQIEQWNKVYNNLNTNDTLYFSHGFGMHYHKYTNINPPNDINIIMVSPKCSGKTVRSNFVNNQGIVSSYAIYKNQQDAFQKCMALAFSIGNNYVFETTFENEVVSDLTGERCILMGMIQAAFVAQFKVLVENGHSPYEAYHETVYESLNSLYPIINERGMSWLYQNCSTTAQRGAIDWSKKFEPKLIDMINECYQSVKDETEVKRVIEYNKKDNHKQKLTEELQEIENLEIWQIDIELRQINNNLIIKNRKNLNSANDNDDNSRKEKWNGFLL